MSEKNRGLSFEKIDHFTNRDVQMLQHDFSTADSVPAATIKIFAKEIADQINSVQTLDEQKIFLIDLLQDEALERIINLKTKAAGYSQEDIEEIKKMAKHSTKQIKKAVAEELKKYLPEELYFFIKKYVTTEQGSHNTRMIIQNKDGELFLKITDQYNEEERNNLQAALDTLREAMSELSNPAQEMPYLPQPTMISHSKKSSNKNLGFAVKPQEIATLQEIFADEEKALSLKEKLNALIDCLRGAKFLADHNITLTDLSTRQPGRNMGIDKKTKKGILFDLDGLLPTDMRPLSMVAAVDNNGKSDVSLIAPEYTHPTIGGIKTGKESMIWEFGDTINRLAEEKLKKLWSSGNIFSNHSAISTWEKLKEFSHKMTSEKPEDRPSFDICIAKLQGIVDKYLD